MSFLSRVNKALFGFEWNLNETVQIHQNRQPSFLVLTQNVISRFILMNSGRISLWHCVLMKL